MYLSGPSSFAGVSSSSEDLISYDEALRRLDVVADNSVASQDDSGSESCQALLCEAPSLQGNRHMLLPLLNAVGWMSANTMRAPYSTPLNDTSAMDGFVVNASSTCAASKDNPLRLRVVDSIAAGDAPLRPLPYYQEPGGQDHICAEIMTGACFPHNLPYLDSVVKIEDVSVEQNSTERSMVVRSYIVLTQPVKSSEHRRLTGSDFTKGDMIIKQGTVIQPKHVAALASLGFTHIEVSNCQAHTTPSTTAGLKVGVLSTGSEIVSGCDRIHDNTHLDSTPKQVVPDSNGPYMISNLKASCHTLAAEYLGVMQDDEQEMINRLQKSIFEDGFDIVVTSGGVSKGRHDLVRHVVETRLEGRIIFHGVKIRPGAPILVALFEHTDEVIQKTGRHQTVFFGVPGNPLAAAVALRFFILPFILGTIKAERGYMKQELRLAQFLDYDRKAVLLQSKTQEKDSEHANPIRRKSLDWTCFWLARWQSETSECVELLDDQASHKLRGMLEADCWVTIPADSAAIYPGDLLLASPF